MLGIVCYHVMMVVEGTNPNHGKLDQWLGNIKVAMVLPKICSGMTVLALTNASQVGLGIRKVQWLSRLKG